MGQERYLRPITSKPKRRPFCAIDLESKDGDTQDPGFERPFLVGLYEPVKEEYQQFQNEPHLKHRAWARRHVELGGCVDKLMNVVLTRRYSGYVFYAHNGGSFDWLHLLVWLQEHRDEYEFEVVPIQSTIQILRVWKLPENPEDPVKDKWDFLDSMRLLPMSLDKACKTFGLPSKLEHDLAMHEDDERWGLYLKQDCVALAGVMTKLHELVENKLGGEVGITAPSTAMKLFRRRFLGKGGCPDRIDRYQHWSDCELGALCKGCCHAWIRLGYYGGRTEIFRFFGERLHYYDLNSSYVHAMRQLMPVADRMVERGKISWQHHPSQGGSYSGFAECTVEIPADCPIPPLPSRHPETGKLVFQTGRFSGVWSLEELRLLDDPLVRGRIVKVVKTVWFGLRDVFSGMVDELWKLRDKRLEGYDEGLSALAKLLGNSTYGKFAMKQERSQIVFAKRHEPRPDGSRRCFLCGETSATGLCPDCEGSKPACDDPDSDVWYKVQRTDAAYIIPQIAAHVTALARVRLWGFMKMAIEAGGKLYYTDTDSLITDVELPTSEALGDLKDEYPGDLLDFVAVQPKVYMITKRKTGEKKVTMKGFNKELRTPENLEKLAAGIGKDEGVIDTLPDGKPWRRLEKVRSLARNGFKEGPKMNHVRKGFNTRYDKRKALEDDGPVLPADKGGTRAHWSWEEEEFVDEEREAEE
jgi:hypothetical protein